MNKRAFAIVFLLVLNFFITWSMIGTPSASAQIGETLSRIGMETDLPQQEADFVLMNFLLWLLRIFTILAVLAFVISGILFLFAGTNKNLADMARNGVTYAIIGLVVALSAYIIILLVSDLLGAGNQGFFFF